MTQTSSASRPSPHAQNAVDDGSEHAQGFDNAQILRAAAEAAQHHRSVPLSITWPEGTHLAVNLTVDFDAMILRKLLKEPAGQLAKGEFGGRVGVWRFLELFNAYDVKGTFFVPGRIGELYPDSLKALAESGHEIADHMWEHRVPGDPRIERDHLLRTTDALEALTGQRPVGTRSWYSNELLVEAGYTYNSHGSADTLPYRATDDDGNSLINLPFHYSWDDAMYFNFAWLNTENAAQRITDPDRVLELWWDGFLNQYQRGGYMNICMHPEFTGRALRIRMLEELIVRMKQLPGVWLTSCADVVEHAIKKGI